MSELAKIPHDPKHNLHQRINACQREVAYVQKDKNVDRKYDVATYDAVVAVVRNSLVEHGIVIETNLVKGETVEAGGVSQSGKKWIRYEGEFEVIFVNIDNPEDRAKMIVPAHADDLGDKAPGKAQTYATKGAIKKMLLLETGDDEEGRRPGTAEDAGDGKGPVNPPPERTRPAAKAEPSKPAGNGKVASAGEIKFATTKLGSPENVAAFCTHLGIPSIDKLPDGAGKGVSAFLASQ